VASGEGSDVVISYYPSKEAILQNWDHIVSAVDFGANIEGISQLTLQESE